jgi:hypothetical protein
MLVSGGLLLSSDDDVLGAPPNVDDSITAIPLKRSASAHTPAVTALILWRRLYRIANR